MFPFPKSFEVALDITERSVSERSALADSALRSVLLLTATS
jgi:hypothetical protein